MFNKIQMSKKLSEFFGKTADEKARETEFVQRESKLTGALFLQIFVLGFLENPKASLNFLCQVAEDSGLIIRKQGLQKRLTSAAVTFMKAMFEEAKDVLQNQVPLPLTLLTQFKAVQLLDSTGISLPDKLANEFPASGGSGPQAGLKLQTMWDFLRGNLTAIWQTTGRKSDQGFTDYLAHIIPGGLFLADLGYFVLSSLQQIMDKEAYFISRFSTNTGLLHPNTKEQFDLLAHLRQTTASHIDMNVLVGIKLQLPCRLVAVRLPTKIVAERCRKAKLKARKKGRTLSQKALEWLAWSVYITNVPVAMLSIQEIVLMYTLRWQVELLFKLWKSEGELDRVAGFKRERLLCELYAKLIGFIMFHFLTAPVRWEKEELSPTKAFQTLRRHIMELSQSLSSPLSLYQTIAKLTRRWRRYGLKDKRRKRQSTCRQIELAAAQSVMPQLLPAVTTPAPVEASQPHQVFLATDFSRYMVLTELFGVEYEAELDHWTNAYSKLAA